MRITIVAATALLCFSAGAGAEDALSLSTQDGTRAMFYFQKSFGNSRHASPLFNVGLRFDRQVTGIVVGSSGDLRLPAYVPLVDVNLTRDDLILRLVGEPFMGYGQLNAAGDDKGKGDSSKGDSSKGDSSEDSSANWWTADSWKNPWFIGTLVVVGGLAIWCAVDCGGSSSSSSSPY